MNKLLVFIFLIISNVGCSQDSSMFDQIDNLIEKQSLVASKRSYSMERTDTTKQGSKILSVLVKEAIREEGTEKWLNLNVQQLVGKSSTLIQYFFLNNSLAKVYFRKSKGEQILEDRYIYFQGGNYIGQRGYEPQKTQEIHLELAKQYIKEFQ